jgi:hypothetical protein
MTYSGRSTTSKIIRVARRFVDALKRSLQPDAEEQGPVVLTLPPRLSVEEIVRYGSDNELAAFLGGSSGCLRCEWHEISPSLV